MSYINEEEINPDNNTAKWMLEKVFFCIYIVRC